MVMINAGRVADATDVESPARESAGRLIQWAEADWEFLRKLCMNNIEEESPSKFAPPIPRGHVQPRWNYHGIDVERQKFLRSFKFTLLEKYNQESDGAVLSRKIKKWLNRKTKANSSGDDQKGKGKRKGLGDDNINITSTLDHCYLSSWRMLHRFYRLKQITL